jgi:SAM-dependent methyltransferase
MRFGFCTEDEPAAEQLHAKLVEFYNKTQDYSAFAEPSFHPLLWDVIRTKIATIIAQKGQCALLEIGAGRTDLARYLGDLRAKTVFSVQDVTASNKHYLEEAADKVYIGSIESIEQSFDIICGSYVLEHLTRPRHAIDHLLAHLNHAGSMILLNPRYDFPFYLSPSCKHRHPLTRFFLALWLQYKRLGVVLGGQPNFLIDSDPSLFYMPWFRDADAIHWVSLFDIKRQIPAGYRLQHVPLNYRGWKGVLWEKFCLLSVEITRG